MRFNKLALFLLLVIPASAVLAERPSIVGLQVELNKLNSRMNELEAQLAQVKPVYVKSNNITVGVFIGLSGGQGPTISFINDQGYIVEISTGGNWTKEGKVLPVGNGGNLTYELPGCQGQAYIFHNIGMGDVLPNTGVVTRSPYELDAIQIYYLPKGSLPVNDISLISELTPDGCREYTTSHPRVWPVHPNEPMVTGVSATLYSTPITLKRASSP